MLLIVSEAFVATLCQVAEKQFSILKLQCKVMEDPSKKFNETSIFVLDIGWGTSPSTTPLLFPIGLGHANLHMICKSGSVSNQVLVHTLVRSW